MSDAEANTEGAREAWRDAPFVPGLELSGALYAEAVRPILDRRFPGLSHSAARIGRGSEVLGFDTHQSRDHDWGPRVTLFLREAQYGEREAIRRVLADELPCEVRGYPTHFADPHFDGGLMRAVTAGPVDHGVSITTTARFFRDYIGFHPMDGATDMDWLAAPGQRLRTVAHGRVFHDGLGELGPGVSPFWGRPYQVPHAARFTNALIAAIGRSAIRALPSWAPCRSSRIPRM